MIDNTKKNHLHLFILVYFVLLTSYLSLITFSKYSSTLSPSGTDSIAKWDVSLNTTDNPNDSIDIVSGNTTQEYILKITSLSEVAANYSIVLSNVPSGIQVSLDSGSPVASNNGEITFSNVGTINANAITANRTITHTLEFSSVIGTNTINNNNVYVDVVINQGSIIAQ